MLAHYDICLRTAVKFIVVYLSYLVDDVANAVVQVIVLESFVSNIISLHIEYESVLSNSVFLAIENLMYFLSILKLP